MEFTGRSRTTRTNDRAAAPDDYFAARYTCVSTGIVTL